MNGRDNVPQTSPTGMVNGMALLPNREMGPVAQPVNGAANYLGQPPVTAPMMNVMHTPHVVQSGPTPQQQPMNRVDQNIVKLANDRYNMLPPVGKQYLMRLTPEVRGQILTNLDFYNRLYQMSVAQTQAFAMNYMQAHQNQVNNRRKKDDDYDDEEPVPLESSDEAEFSGAEEEDENFDELPPDYVPPVVPPRVFETRQNKKKVCRDELYADEDSSEEDIDESGNAGDGLSSFVDRIEHIYLTRVSGSGVEYLLRFQESPPGMCQWVPESVVEVLPKGKHFIERFQNTAPCSLEEISGDERILYPVAHRRETPNSKPELLFRLFLENNAMFFWDICDEQMENEYFASRKCFPAVENPPRPTETDVLPEPDSTLISSKSGDKLRDYQVLGVKWMIDCWRRGHGSILADEMGLGKTIQLLSFLTYLNRYCNWHGPFAIIVRVNTFKQWCDEISKWTDLAFVAYNSLPSARGIIREFQFPALDDLGKPIPGTFAFNILLVTYDVFLKDVEYMEKIQWQVLVLDEGHRIKNSQGKKNQVFASVPALHRIILTGTPIQNSLEELWALLRFVSPEAFSETPEFLETELEDLTNETIFEIRNLIAPHLLHRSLMDVEHSIGPKEERVVFVGLTDVQRDLIRLIKLHKSWRLKGVCQGNEEEAEGSNEPHLLFRVCSHPFLLPDAETFYTKKLRMKERVELLLRVSTKFQWLDNVLKVLHAQNHRVLIFSQRVELLQLLDEFVGMRGYSKEMLIGAMTDTEKQAAIDNYRSNNCFIFLISTKAGSEGLNLTEADTAILFDPDWNPQNDIQAQARCYRIGQTQKVDVLRLCTFQTYEHYIFVKAQRKLGLWLTILGSKDVSILHQTDANSTQLPDPPAVTRITDASTPLDSLLEQTSTVVRDFSLDTLPILEKALKDAGEMQYDTPDEVFLESFPVVVEGTGKRSKRSRSRDLLINRSGAERLFNRMKKFGFQDWESIAEGEDYDIDQVRRFCLMLTLLSFRAVKPSLITYFPVLSARLLQALAAEEIYLKLQDFMCNSKSAWAQPFNDDFDLTFELDACKKIKDLIMEDAFAYLSVIEMRLIAVCWNTFNSFENFKWSEIAPPYSESDRSLLQAITGSEDFDPFDERIQAIINVMRSDIITAQMMDEYAEITPYWTEIEFNNVASVIKNFPIDFENDTDLHAKTTILGKMTDDVVEFAKRLVDLVKHRKKGKGIVITEKMAHLSAIPREVMRDSMKSWLQVSIKAANELSSRIGLITLIQAKIVDLGSPGKTEEWGPYHTQMYLELLLKHGVDSMREILLDERYEFRHFLSDSDRSFLMHEVKRRDLQQSCLPDFVFSETELMSFVSGGDGGGSSEDGQEERRVRPARSSTRKATKKKKRSRYEKWDDSESDFEGELSLSSSEDM